MELNYNCHCHCLFYNSLRYGSYTAPPNLIDHSAHQFFLLLGIINFNVVLFFLSFDQSGILLLDEEVHRVGVLQLVSSPHTLSIEVSSSSRVPLPATSQYLKHPALLLPSLLHIHKGFFFLNFCQRNLNIFI